MNDIWNCNSTTSSVIGIQSSRRAKTSMTFINPSRSCFAHGRQLSEMIGMHTKPGDNPPLPTHIPRKRPAQKRRSSTNLCGINLESSSVLIRSQQLNAILLLQSQSHFHSLFVCQARPLTVPLTRTNSLS
jgi:hypothetical protein